KQIEYIPLLLFEHFMLKEMGNPVRDLEFTAIHTEKIIQGTVFCCIGCKLFAVPGFWNDENFQPVAACMSVHFFVYSSILPCLHLHPSSSIHTQYPGGPCYLFR